MILSRRRDGSHLNIFEEDLAGRSACHAVTRGILYSFIKCVAQGCHAVPVGGAKRSCTPHKEQCGFSLKKTAQSHTFPGSGLTLIYNSLILRTLMEKKQGNDKQTIKTLWYFIICIRTVKKVL